MIVLEAVSQRYDIQTGKFCDLGIVREDEQLLGQEIAMIEGQVRSSSVFSAFRSTQKLSKPGNTHHVVAQRECRFSRRAKAEGKYVIKMKYDDDLEDEIEESANENEVPTTADFIKKLKVGDSIELWAPVVRGNCVYRIDEVRMHAFWAV